MLILNRKRDRVKKAVGISVAVLLAAHAAVGLALCKKSCRASLERMAKKAKRTVVGLVRELG